MKKAGFTLVELMTTLVVLGVLGVLVVPAYQEYIISARTAEAYQTIGTMINQQKAYFYDHKKFCSASWEPGNDYSGSSNNAWSSPYQPTDLNYVSHGWSEVGYPVAPGSQTYFRYIAVAGSGSSQRHGCSDTLSTASSLTNGIMYGFADSTQNDLRRAQCKNSPYTFVPEAEYPPPAEPTFNPSTFGVTEPSSGTYDWVVFVAQGNLRPDTTECRFVGISMDASSITGNIPSMSRGFIVFDMDFAASKDGVHGAVNEPPDDDAPPDTP